jgi:hypothetical protein
MQRGDDGMAEPDTPPKPTPQATIDLPATLATLRAAQENIVRELRKVIVGEDEPIHQVLAAMVAGGH